MKPIIGLSVDLGGGDKPQARINTSYYEAIAKSGGIPILIPPMSERDLKQLLPMLNGIVFIGGHDYSPELYGEVPTDKVVPINPQREKFDLRLMKAALERVDLPILAICGGLQLLNIALGGSLIQDIQTHNKSSPIAHRSDQGLCWHRVRFYSTGSLGAIYQSDRLSVVSSHHQAIKELGAGLQICSLADDGIIEAVELPGRPFTIGVQWHPERDYQGNKRLFRAFVRQARKTLC